MSNVDDLIGQRFGRLTVIQKASEGRKRYLCKCDCGNSITLVPCRLRKYKSCGCYEKENMKIISKSALTHGKTNTRLYGIWCRMKDRCNNPNLEHYDCYGGRGIKVCDEWQHSFESFYEWAMSSGYRNDLSIDRIDVNGDYEPSNCRWATLTEQQRNKRNTVYVMDNGIKISISEACEKYGIDKNFMWRKVKAGFTLPDIISRWEYNHSHQTG